MCYNRLKVPKFNPAVRRSAGVGVEPLPLLWAVLICTEMLNRKFALWIHSKLHMLIRIKTLCLFSGSDCTETFISPGSQESTPNMHLTLSKNRQTEISSRSYRFRVGVSDRVTTDGGVFKSSWNTNPVVDLLPGERGVGVTVLLHSSLEFYYIIHTLYMTHERCTWSNEKISYDCSVCDSTADERESEEKICVLCISWGLKVPS